MIDYRTKKISDQDLAIKLHNCLFDLFKYIHSNCAKLAFANISKTKIDLTGISVRINPDDIYSKHKFIKPEYISEEIIHPYKKSHFDLYINDDIYSMFVLSCIDNQSEGWYDDYATKSTISITLNCSMYRYNNTDEKYINACKRFINKIPKKSRNKLVKMLYFHEKTPKENRDFKEYAILYKRLKERFDLHIGGRYGTNTKITFDRLIQTYDDIDNRNRKLNKLLRRK